MIRILVDIPNRRKYPLKDNNVNDSLNLVKWDTRLVRCHLLQDACNPNQWQLKSLMFKFAHEDINLEETLQLILRKFHETTIFW